MEAFRHAFVKNDACFVFFNTERECVLLTLCRIMTAAGTTKALEQEEKMALLQLGKD